MNVFKEKSQRDISRINVEKIDAVILAGKDTMYGNVPSKKLTRNINNMLQKILRSYKNVFELCHQYDKKKNLNNSPNAYSIGLETSANEKETTRSKFLEIIHAFYKPKNVDEFSL